MFFTAEDYLAMAFYENAPTYGKYAKIAAKKLGEIGKIVIKGLKDNAEDEWRTARSEGGAILGETEWVKNYLKSLEIDPDNKSLNQNIQALLKSQPNDAALRIFYATLKHPATKVAVTVGSDLAKKYSTNSTEVQLRELLKNASKEELHQVISDPTFTPQVIAFTSAELTERNAQEIVRLKGSYSEQQVKELRESIDAEMRRRKANQNFDPQSPFEIQTSDPDLRDSLKNFNEFMQNSKRENDRIAYYNSFNFLINVGQATGCRELAMLGTVGTMGIQLHAAITTLSALPAGASFGLMLSPMTAIASVGLALFAIFQKSEPDRSLQLMLEQISNQLQQISEQIQNLHMDMRKNFEVVFGYLDNIVKSLEKHHYELVSIANQIETLSINASKYNVNTEYFLKSIYLQKFKSALYQITRGNEHSQDNTSFRNLFKDIFESLEEYSFDPGCNGYTRAIEPNDHRLLSFPVKQVREVLAAPLEYRLGYLAAIIGFPQAEKMMIPCMFSDSISGLNLLIERWLQYHGNVPIGNVDRSFDQLIDNVIAKALFTEQFISFSRTPAVVDRAVQSYRQSIVNLVNIVTNWRNSTENRFHIDCMQPIAQLHSQMDLLNGHTTATQRPGCSSFPSGWNMQNLPIDYYVQQTANNNPLANEVLKYVSLLEKLQVGRIEPQLEGSITTIGDMFEGHWHLYCNVFIDFVDSNNHKTMLVQDNLFSDFRSIPPSRMPIANWNNHSFVSQKCTVDEQTKNNFKNTATNKLKEIRSELLDVNNSYGIEAGKACAEIQKNYEILKALNELHGVPTRAISGDQIHAMLSRFVEQGGVSSINILAQISEVTNSILSPVYPEQNAIVTRIRTDIVKLNATKEKVREIIENYNENERIKEQLRLAKEEQTRVETEQRELEQREMTNKQIDEIARAEGMVRTKELMINFLTSKGKVLEAALLNEKLSYIEQGTIDGEISHQYKTSFILGSNFALTQATVVLSSHQYGTTAMYLAKEGMKGIERMLGSSRLLEPIFQPAITSSSSASCSSRPLSALNSEDSRQQSTVFFSNPFSSAEEVTVTNSDAEVIETATELRQQRQRLN
ncbi:MAG: hypothetical protein ABSA84_01210 [Gammaproteobacteria bacterium]